MRKKVMIGVAMLVFTVVVSALKGRKEEPRLPYQLPTLSREEPAPQSRYDEYESVLAGRESRPLQAQTKEARLSFTSLFRKAPQEPQAEATNQKAVHQKAKKRSKPAEPAFFSYKGQGEAQHFVKAVIYRDQQVRAGDGMVVQLQERCTAGGRTLHQGTLLYGAVRMSGNRLLLTLTAAEYEGRRFPVSMTCYDTDLLPGIAYAEAGAWEGPREQAIDRVLRHADRGLLKDIGQGASIAYKAWRRKPQATLEDGRIVYVSALEK